MQPSADVCSAITVWLIPLQEAQICLLCFQDQITELCGGLLCVCVSLFCWLWQRNESCHGEWCASYSVFRRRSFSDTTAWFSSSYDLEWFPMGRFMFANRLCAGGFSDRPRFTDRVFFLFAQKQEVNLVTENCDHRGRCWLYLTPRVVWLEEQHWLDS